MPVEVHLPTRVAVDAAGLAKDDGAAVGAAVAAASERAVATASDVVATRHGPPAQVVVHPPTVTWSGEGAASVPAAARARIERQLLDALEKPGRPIGSARPAAPAGHVVKVIELRARLGALAALHDDLAGGAYGLRSLYAEQAEEVHRATLRVVQARRRVPLAELVEEVEQAIPKRSGEAFWFAYTVEPADRLRLLLLDEGGGLARALPDLTPNERLVDGTPLVLSRGALVAFLSFSAPIRAAAGILLGPDLAVELPLRELGFLIEPDSFRAAFGVDWQQYSDELGDRRATLHLQQLTTRKGLHHDTLDQLLRDEVRRSRVARGAWFFGELMLLTRARLEALPEPARAELAPNARPATLALPGGSEPGRWQPDWDGAFAYVALTPDRADRELVRERALARARATELIALLQADRSHLLWAYNILTLLRQAYRPQPASFKYLLRELEEREGGRWFRTLFDFVDAQENGDLHWYLIDLVSQTPYARHQRAIASLALLNRRRRAYLPHLYYEDAKEIRLHRDAGRTLRVGGRIYDIDHDYRAEKTDKVLKPEREKALIAQVQKVAPKVIEGILTGTDKRQFADSQALVAAIVEQAATELKLGEDDLYERKTERTLVLTDVQRRTDPFERYLISFYLEERVTEGDAAPTAWQRVKDGERTYVDIDFQWLIWGWEYQHMAARREAFAIGVVAVSFLPIVIIGTPVLVELAGGWAAVGWSIGLSEAFYVGSTLWKGEKFSIEGFVMAAVDGYIGALGFRAGSLPASALARQIGGATTRKVVAGWIVDKTVTSLVGGAGAAAATYFAHDLVNISMGRQERISSAEDYVRTMKMGLLLGFCFEAGASALKPVLRAAGSEAAASAALETAEDVANAARRAGLSPAAWKKLVLEVLEAIGPKLKQAFTEEMEKGLKKAIGERLGEVGEHLAGIPGRIPGEARRQFLERALEVSGMHLSAGAAPGLRRFAKLSAESLGEESSLALLQRLHKAGRLHGFLEGMAALDDDLVGALARGRQLEALASSKHVLDLVRRRRGHDVLVLVEQSFGKDIASADAFLARLSEQAGGQRDAALDVLLRPGQAIPPESLMLALKQGVTLTDEAVEALDRLFESGLEAEQVNALLRATDVRNLPGLLRLVAGAAPQELEALLQSKLLRALSRSPAMLRFAQQPGGLERLFKLLHPRGRLGADPEAVVDALERLMKRRPGTSMEELGTIVDGLTFPLVDATPEQIEAAVEASFGETPTVKSGYIEASARIEGGAPEEFRVPEVEVVPKGKTIKKYGRTYKEGEIVPPLPDRLDMQDIPLTEEELKIVQPELRQRAALARVRRVIGRKLSKTPLGKVWDDIRAEMLAGRTPQQVGREEMLELYNKMRDEFWDRIRDSAEHKQWLLEAGFHIDETKAAYLGVSNPRFDPSQTSVTLDHQLEKSWRENWQHAVEADNLVLEFAQPNTFIDRVQDAFSSGSYEPSVSPIGGWRLVSPKN